MTDNTEESLQSLSNNNNVLRLDDIEKKLLVIDEQNKEQLTKATKRISAQEETYRIMMNKVTDITKRLIAQETANKDLCTKMGDTIIVSQSKENIVNGQDTETNLKLKNIETKLKIEEDKNVSLVNQLKTMEQKLLSNEESNNDLMNQLITLKKRLDSFEEKNDEKIEELFHPLKETNNKCTIKFIEIENKIKEQDEFNKELLIKEEGCGNAIKLLDESSNDLLVKYNDLRKNYLDIDQSIKVKIGEIDNLTKEVKLQKDFINEHYESLESKIENSLIFETINQRQEDIKNDLKSRIDNIEEGIITYINNKEVIEKIESLIIDIDSLKQEQIQLIESQKKYFTRTESVEKRIESNDDNYKDIIIKLEAIEKESKLYKEQQDNEIKIVKNIIQTSEIMNKEQKDRTNSIELILQSYGQINSKYQKNIDDLNKRTQLQEETIKGLTITIETFDMDYKESLLKHNDIHHNMNVIEEKIIRNNNKIDTIGKNIESHNDTILKIETLLKSQEDQLNKQENHMKYSDQKLKIQEEDIEKLLLKMDSNHDDFNTHIILVKENITSIKSNIDNISKIQKEDFNIYKTYQDNTNKKFSLQEDNTKEIVRKMEIIDEKFMPLKKTIDNVCVDYEKLSKEMLTQFNLINGQILIINNTKNDLKKMITSDNLIIKELSKTINNIEIKCSSQEDINKQIYSKIDDNNHPLIKAKVSSLDAEINNHLFKIESIEKALSIQEDANKELVATIDNKIQSEISTINQDYNIKIDNINESLNSFKMISKDLFEKSSILLGKVNLQEESNKSLIQKVNTIDLSIRTIENNNKNNQVITKTIENSVQSMKEESNQLKHSLTVIDNTLHFHKEGYNQINTFLNQLVSLEEQIKLTISTHQLFKENILKQLNNLNDQVSESQKSITEFKDSKQVLGNTNQSFLNQVFEISQNIKDINNQFTLIKSNNNKTFSDLNSQIESLKNKLQLNTNDISKTEKNTINSIKAFQLTFAQEKTQYDSQFKAIWDSITLMVQNTKSI